jgi:UMP-CMP kinase
VLLLLLFVVVLVVVAAGGKPMTNAISDVFDEVTIRAVTKPDLYSWLCCSSVLAMSSPSSWSKICPFSAGLFIVSTILIVRALDDANRKRQLLAEGSTTAGAGSKQDPSSSPSPPSFRVVFVLGAPGVGKGTQCQLLCANDPTWCHLSAGDLLRAERKTSSGLAAEINRCIDAGQLVRSEITCQLLQNAMRAAYNDNNDTDTHRCTNFLIDGYPRSQGNVDAWDQFCTSSNNNSILRTDVAFVLNFICPEDLLVGRLLERGKSSGRNDDNLATIQKRFQTFQTETNPIIDWYKTQTNIPVYDIRTDKAVEQVYRDTLRYFATTKLTETTTTTTTTTTMA